MSEEISDNLSSDSVPEDLEKIRIENGLESAISSDTENDNYSKKVLSDIPDKNDIPDETDSELSINDYFISNKIEDYERKLKEQEDYHKKLNDLSTASSDIQDENEISNPDKDKLYQSHNLEKKLEQLHDDIRVCELYKKNLEFEIRNYKQNISEIKDLERIVFNLKNDLIKFKEAYNSLKIEKIILTEKVNKLKIFSSEFEKRINNLFAAFELKNKEFESIKNQNEILKNEIEFLENAKNILNEEITSLLDRKEGLSIEYNTVALKKSNIDDEIAKHIADLREELEKQVEKYNELMT